MNRNSSRREDEERTRLVFLCGALLVHILERLGDFVFYLLHNVHEHFDSLILLLLVLSFHCINFDVRRSRDVAFYLLLGSSKELYSFTWNT